MIDDNELISRVALTSVLGIGPKMYETLLLTFGSARAVFEASYSSFTHIPRFARTLYEQIQELDHQAIAAQMETWRRQGIVISVKGSEHYPVNMAGQADAPAVLFLSRQWQEPRAGSIAIVGTRQPTKSCCFFAEHVATHLAATGITIISGMAAGIDRNAHVGALKVNGSTVAVLGNGILIPFPPANADIYASIARNGLIMSELMPRVAPSAGTLIARNRIIAGLADLTLVIEAQRHGGSIETGMKTLNMSKRLLVYDTDASGNRFLMRQGGIPVRNVQQVVEYLDWGPGPDEGPLPRREQGLPI
ncbi:DNA-protecting protein DprA [bacterium]|nr:DNA-protecting protein DprA [bacterium]